MARAAKPKKEISMEEALWKSADKLRGSVEPAEYKHVVLSLFFLKFASDKFEECRNKIIATHGEKYADMKPFYTQENVFYLPEESRWKYIIENAKQDDIALKIDTALYTIEKNNPALKGALPDNYYSRLHIDTAKLASLLDEINRINTDDKENDIIGRVYEYFLSKFALAEGKGKGEFYTPKCIVNLIAEMLEPYDGILYDPCCGSGGMFVQSIKFVEAHSGNKKKVSIYGQEYTNTTFKLAKMNLAIRGISANLGEMAANTFTNDQHKDLKADFIMANPPFNQKQWRAENELVDDSDSVIYVSTYGYEITNSKGEKSTYADALWIDTVLPISQIERYIEKSGVAEPSNISFVGDSDECGNYKVWIIAQEENNPHIIELTDRKKIDHMIILYWD